MTKAFAQYIARMDFALMVCRYGRAAAERILKAEAALLAAQQDREQAQAACVDLGKAYGLLQRTRQAEAALLAAQQEIARLKAAAVAFMDATAQVCTADGSFPKTPSMRVELKDIPADVQRDIETNLRAGRTP